MAGAPSKHIQELAGHSTLAMTLRYMHLAPGALHDAIALLDKKHRAATCSDVVKAAS